MYLLMIFVANISMQYVNSIKCIVIHGVEVPGGGMLYGWPKKTKKCWI